MVVFLIGVMILGCLGVVCVRSRGEEGDAFGRMGSFLYECFCRYGLPVTETEEVAKYLEQLYPGEHLQSLKKAYYTEKLRLVLLVVFVGTLLCMAVQIKYWAEGGDVVEIARGEAGSEVRQVMLEARVGEEREEILVEVSGQKLMPKEVEELLDECIFELGQLVADGIVSGTEELPELLEGYPFEILWRKADEGELTAYLYYGEDIYTHTFWVETEPVTVDDSLAVDLQQAVTSQNVKTQYEKQLVLPTHLNGSEITWREVRENNSSVFLLLTVLAAVGVFVLKDKDLHEEWNKKKRSMQLSYPAILNKFVLYMGAGLTVRGSFVKIATDYHGKGMVGEGIAYEEMLYSCNELSAGISESLVYERFGRRSGLQEYARFATMLSQNLKKGNATLLHRLREESEKAQEENLQLKKRLGEEAQTKLLVPMIMMMAIVMLLVMMPAFSSF